MEYLDVVYYTVRDEFKGFDSVYEDAITELVGTHGLNALKEAKVLETCGVINGRQLYTLLDSKRF